jgi:acetolactate synthase-1/2/3 large subunit
VGPGQTYSTMVTGPFIPSRSERNSDTADTVHRAPADMF